jgi:hypothetical protein
LWPHRQSGGENTLRPDGMAHASGHSYVTVARWLDALPRRWW